RDSVAHGRPLKPSWLQVALPFANEFRGVPRQSGSWKSESPPLPAPAHQLIEGRLSQFAPVRVHPILSAASAAVSRNCLGFGLRATNNPTATTKTPAAEPNHGHACDIAFHVKSSNIAVYCAFDRCVSRQTALRTFHYRIERQP